MKSFKVDKNKRYVIQENGHLHIRETGVILYIKKGENTMKEYTVKEMKILKSNPYTFKVTKKKLYFTAEFKEIFWTGYQAGTAPRKLLEDMGYDLEMFSQKQIDSLVQRIKKQAQSGYGFTEGEKRIRRMKDETVNTENIQAGSPNITVQIWNEVKYLRQEVEFLKKIVKTENARKVKKV